MTLPYTLASNGLPLGIQLTAAPLHEGLLLEAAKAIESVIGFQAKPGGWGRANGRPPQKF